MRISRSSRQSHNQTVRTIGDGTTAIAAFGDALNKSDFSDVTFKVSFSAGENNNNNAVSSSSGKNYHNKSSKKQQHQDPSTTSGAESSSSATTATTTTTIYAHRAILAARSPVFRQMFFGGFPESKQKEVAVVDEFKPQHFMTVLEWAYTGRAEMSAKDVLGVLRCANFYGFDDLVAESRDLAQSFIDEENVLHLLEHASQLGETTLVYQCLNFIKCHAHSVLTSPVWLGVSPECVERVLQLPAIDCEEALLFEQALAWLETNTTLRADLVEEEEKKRREEKKKLSMESSASGASSSITSRKNKKNKKNSKKNDDDQANDENQNEEEKKNDEQDENEHQESEHDEQDEQDEEEEEEDEDLDDEERERRRAERALIEASQDAPYQSSPLVRRFFKHLRLSHLSVGHLLDRVRPLLGAHPSIRPDYVSALEFLVDPGHLNEVSQVPRAPTVLATVQVDVPSEFLRGWRLLVSIPQSSPNHGGAFGYNQAQVLGSNFFNLVPQHASYVCVGEMVVGRDDVISIIAVGTVRIVRPIINSRSPVVAEEGDICWHASTNSFGFTPKQQQGSGSSSSGGAGASTSSNSVVSGMPGRSFAAPAPSRANQSAGVRFIVSSTGNVNTAAQQQQQVGNSPTGMSESGSSSSNAAQQQRSSSATASWHTGVSTTNSNNSDDGGVRHGKRFIYYK